MQAARQATRLQREIRMLQTDPPPGVCAWPCNESLSHLEAQIQGPDETVYEKGIFKLEVRVPERYPFEPPNVRFKTPIYHPNIDSGGRICLDILNMPPKGAWKPSLNIPTVLASIGLLLAEPNPDDGLMGDITAEYKHHRAAFDAKAKQWTAQYAVENRSEDESHRPHESLQLNPEEHETSVSKSTETIFRARNAHHFSFGLGFDEEPAEVISRGVSGSGEKQLTSSIRENIRGPLSGNPKLNLSRKLTLGKGPTVSEREDTTTTSATETSSASQPLGNVHTPPSTLAQQQKRKSTFELTGLRERTSTEHTKSSGASSSASDASLRLGAEVNTGITDISPHFPCIDDAEAIGPIPRPSPSVSATASIDFQKFERPVDASANSTVPPKIEKQEILNGSSASAAAPVTKANSASGNRGVIPKHSFLSFPKTPRAGNGSGLSETENLPTGAGDRLSSLVSSITKACFSDSQHQTAQNFTPNSLRGSARHVAVVTGPPYGQAVPMEAKEVSSNPPRRHRDEHSNERSGQGGVHSEMAKRLSGNGSINTKRAECVEVLNKEGQIMDCRSGDGAECLDPSVSRSENHKWKTALSGIESLAPETVKTSREGSHKTSASPVSTGILKPKPVNIIHVFEVGASSVRETTNSTAAQNSVGGNSSPVISKYFTQENAKGLSGTAQPQKPSKVNGNHLGLTKLASQIDQPASIDLDSESASEVSRTAEAECLSKRAGHKTERTMKASQIDPAALIVLDSESDEEPPKARSRLSLAHRKGVKRNDKK